MTTTVLLQLRSY